MFWETVFGWPNGIVVGNLIASFLIWLLFSLPAFVIHHKIIKRHIYRRKQMPYKAVKDGENWKVVNEKTGETKATHEPPGAEEKAKRQVKLLEAVENDPGWE